jgi:sugar (pentulose or hexulose) kinase
MAYLIAVDVGTSSTKTALYHAGGQVCPRRWWNTLSADLPKLAEMEVE